MSEFKVGDHIVIDQKYNKTFMPVLQIISEGKNYFYCNDGQVHKSQMEQWRKAEPEEIAAGHRIDKPSDSGELETLDKLENHISLNCKVEDV
ncbi:hypothetical protein [Acinetobacter nosocomialis]|uniref:hypothetical protein n=1 Tax=Acinetobacter nosocomialis TaxID=106654 RepID=UPI0025A1F418|nr:hypothetical protein [Acinetobacter nosocomialis]